MATTETTSPTNDAGTTPGAGPAPRVLTENELSLMLRDQRFGVLATVRRSGHPHLSTVIHRWSPEERVLRISSTADRLKVRQLRRDPHAAVHVGAPDGWSFAVAEGEAEVSEVTAVAGDAVGRELLSMTPGFADPREEAAFLEQLVAAPALAHTEASGSDSHTPAKNATLAFESEPQKPARPLNSSPPPGRPHPRPPRARRARRRTRTASRPPRRRRRTTGPRGPPWESWRLSGRPGRRFRAGPAAARHGHRMSQGAPRRADGPAPRVCCRAEW